MPATSTLWNVQQAIYNKLTQSSALTALLAEGSDSVRDMMPRSASFPYLLIGDISAQPLDTQRYHATEIILSLHCYSRGLGMKEVKNIMAEIAAALHNTDITVTGHTTLLCQEKDLNVFLESDGETRHGIQRFRIIIEQV